MFSIRYICAFLISLLLVGSSGYASDHHCHEHTIVGSYIGTRGTTPDDAFLDQFIFNIDGSVYFNQSSALNLPAINGTFIPEVGSWKIVGDYVFVTVIGAASAPVPGDLALSSYFRFTQKLKIIDKNTLQAIHRVNRQINLNEDPLTAEGTVILDSDVRFFIRKVKVKPDDLG